MAGIIKRNIIIAPCRVYALLYISLEIISLPGAANSNRITKANNPPKKKNRIPLTKYIKPILLWSKVNSQDIIPFGWFK